MDRLPPLSPLTSISRPLSAPEYYHASVGTSRHTLEPPRQVIFVLRGEGSLSAQQWQSALDQVVAVNPGARLRMIGKRSRARWQSDGEPPRLRVLERCDWDTLSERGAEFIEATPLPLETGPTVELIVAPGNGGTSLVILRALHAVVDGSGMLHFLREMFRALRGEPLLGSNASFSDVDLMLSAGITHSTSRHIKTMWLTGAPEGDEMGDEFRRIHLGPPRKDLLAKVATAMAEFAHQYSELPALIAIPVDLRRHCPGLLSTTNFANMLLVRLEKGEGTQVFKHRLQEMLEQRKDMAYPRVLNAIKLLPLPWLDLLLSRTHRNYRKRKPVETAVISNVGRHESATLSCPGFKLHDMVLLPLRGSAFATLTGVDNRVDMTINLPRVLAGNGRFDALVAHLASIAGA